MQIWQKCLFQQYELDHLLVDDNGVAGERIYIEGSKNDDDDDDDDGNDDHGDDVDEDDERSTYIVMHKLRVYRVPEH